MAIHVRQIKKSCPYRYFVTVLVITDQRSGLGLKDILTVFVNLPPYDELSLLRSNHGVAEWFCPARPARQELRMQEMSVVRDQISRWQLRSKPPGTAATAATVRNINKVVETCIYSSDLDGMKNFYTAILGLPLVQEKNGSFFS